MDIDCIRDVVVDVCEDGYLLVDEFGFSLIERKDIVQEGDGIYVARFRLSPGKMPTLGLLSSRIDSATGMHVHPFVVESDENGIKFLNVALVINERTMNA